LRELVAARRQRLGADQLRAAGQSVAERLAEAPEFRERARLVLYAALPDEVPTRPLYEIARASGKRLLWPRTAGRDRLEFAPCERWEDLIPERYGVLAPPPGRESVGLGPEDLLLVPGVAFDLRGGRLGRGGGYFDRALAEFGDRGPLSVGVGFEFQLVEEVPRESHDREVGAVLTERRLQRVGERVR
jgi:5-formyltetrahydrofolate cyclo-ligase